MDTLYYVLLWLALSAVALTILWYVAERAPLMGDDWQDHDSDRCPVEPLTKVDLLFENGDVVLDTTACMWYWYAPNLLACRIVAYRVRGIGQ